MRLRLYRSQRTAGVLSKSVMFMLDARLELTAEEAANVHKYALGNEVIYNSAASRKHLEAADQAVGRETAGGLVSQLAQVAMHRLSLNITIDGLVKGQHIECKDMGELMGAEEAIRQAAHTTHAFLETARTFDGYEEVVEFDSTPELAA
jgi:hypothetical protein